jgi:predicted SAM-dependent methyltransferase
MSKSKLLKLNLGCGSNKIDGYVNIDTEPSTKPDLVLDFVNNKLPYKDNSVNQILLFHVIEHIPKTLRRNFLGELRRVLNIDKGNILISYPEFLKCVDNWKRNYRGKKEFWEATLYGRQLYPSDYHVCIMHTPDFKRILVECGFTDIIAKSEPQEKFNTIISARKGTAFVQYEELIKRDMNSFKTIKQ